MITDKQREMALFSSNKSDWETPKWLFDALDAEFHFTLDAAASEKNHKCARYYSEKTDGLKQDWRGGNCILQSALRQQRNRAMDEKVLGGSSKTRHHLRVAYPRPNGQKIISQVCCRASGDPLRGRPDKI